MLLAGLPINTSTMQWGAAMLLIELLNHGGFVLILDRYSRKCWKVYNYVHLLRPPRGLISLVFMRMNL